MTISLFLLSLVPVLSRFDSSSRLTPTSADKGQRYEHSYTGLHYLCRHVFHLHSYQSKAKEDALSDSFTEAFSFDTFLQMSLNGSANEPSQPTTGPKRMPAPSAVGSSCAQCTHQNIRPNEATTSKARRGVDPYKDTSSYRTFTQLGQGDGKLTEKSLWRATILFYLHLQPLDQCML